jgi:hypothetical protein
MSDPASPRTIVPTKPMVFRPGTNNRAIAPATRPTISHQTMSMLPPSAVACLVLPGAVEANGRLGNIAYAKGKERTGLPPSRQAGGCGPSGPGEGSSGRGPAGPV